jgi:hypothetical protein
MPKTKKKKRPDPILLAIKSSLPAISFASARFRYELIQFWRLSNLRNLEKKSIQLAVFLANVSVFLIAICFTYLWHWTIGLFLVWFALSSTVIFIIFSWLTRRMAIEISDLEWRIFQITDASINIQFLETQDEVIPQATCKYCQSKHQLLIKYPFHPTLHFTECIIPGLRSRVEWINLEIPEIQIKEIQ